MRERQHKYLGSVEGEPDEFALQVLGQGVEDVLQLKARVVNPDSQHQLPLDLDPNRRIRSAVFSVADPARVDPDSAVT